MHSNILADARRQAPGSAPGLNPAALTSGRTLDHVAGIYDTLEPLMMMGMDRALERDVLQHLAARGGGDILDVGCGTGTLTRAIAARLADQRPSRVTGIDAATRMIAVARRKAAGQGNLMFEAALAEALPFADASFDHAVSTMFFHHINAELKVRSLNEIWRTLRPGGSLLIADVAPPTSWFGSVCAWSGYLLFQQDEIRENIKGVLEDCFPRSPFRAWRRQAHYGGYISVYQLEK